MALPLEEMIMMEIGLGQNYLWFNGSGSCEYIRRDAMRKLPAAIQKHHDEGSRIAAPDSQLMALCTESTRWDDSQYELTKVWQIASYVIATHIHTANVEKEMQAQEYKRLTAYIRKTYQVAAKRSLW